MDYRPIERAADAFQQPLEPDLILSLARRAFGADTQVLSAVELGDGMYNNTYRVEIAPERAVILRVAPAPNRQFRSERQLMRNEHASVPYFAPIAPLLPRTLAIDFTHELIARDYLFQTLLPGVPAPEGLAAYPRAQWTEFFRQMGSIAKDIHAVRGARFGPVAGPWHSSWSGALIAAFEDMAADLDDAGLDAKDVRAAAEAAAARSAVLDEIAEPRLLHGDLWTVNVMVRPGAPVPTITGVFDCDRTWWGDPEADWPLFMARRRPGTERDAFWETYGEPAKGAGAEWRGLVYQARHIAAARLEYRRLGQADDIAGTYDDLRELLGRLAV